MFSHCMVTAICVSECAKNDTTKPFSKYFWGKYLFKDKKANFWKIETSMDICGTNVFSKEKKKPRYVV